MELDQEISLKPRSTHDIEAVIDRFRVRPDMEQRLVESFETALRLADGLVDGGDDRSGRECEGKHSVFFTVFLPALWLLPVGTGTEDVFF